MKIATFCFTLSMSKNQECVILLNFAKKCLEVVMFSVFSPLYS